MFVKPAANPAFDKDVAESKANPSVLQVYDPALRDYLPAHGRAIGKDNDLYWHRRVMHGEVAVLSDAEGNAVLEAEAARQQAERKKAEAQEKKDALAATAAAGAEKGK